MAARRHLKVQQDGEQGGGDEQPRWRRDFPVEADEENYIARRDFVKFLVLTSGAFATGQLWIGLDHLLRRQDGQGSSHKAVAKVDELAVGGTLRFEYPTANDSCLLVRTGRDTWRAYSQKCTHLSCAVQPRLEQGKFLCPCHNGWFDAETGRVLAGPPSRPLTKIALEVREGVIYATGVERRT